MPGRPIKIFDRLPLEWRKHKSQIGIQIPTRYMEYLEEIAHYTDGINTVQDLIKLVLVEKYPALVDPEMRKNYINSLREEYTKLQDERAAIESDKEEDNSSPEKARPSANGKFKINTNKIDPDSVEQID